MLLRRATCLVLALVFSRNGFAQGDAAGRARAASESVYARARRLVVGGEAAAGRLLVDSMVAATPTGTAEYAEALYWRASLAATTDDAERDYRRIIVDYPLSRRAGDALLQLGQLEVARSDRVNATAHLQQFLLENPDRPERGRVGYLLTRALLEQNEIVRGCTMLGRARGAIPKDSIELRNQLEYFSSRCTGVDTVIAARAADSVGRGRVGGAGSAVNRSRGRYTLQVAAYPTREAATALAKKLAGRGYESRVDGTKKPFRVRIGYYKTRADAVAAAAKLAASGVKTVVTDTAGEP